MNHTYININLIPKKKYLSSKFNADPIFTLKREQEFTENVTGLAGQQEHDCHVELRISHTNIVFYLNTPVAEEPLLQRQTSSHGVQL